VFRGVVLYEGLFFCLAPREVFVLSYSDLDTVPTKTAGVSPVLASDWNTYVRDNFDSLKRGHIVFADAAARSAVTPAEGTMAFQEDTDELWVFADAAWRFFMRVDGGAYSHDITPRNQTGPTGTITNMDNSCKYHRVGEQYSFYGEVFANGGAPSAFTELWVNLPFVMSDELDIELLLGAGVIPGFNAVLRDDSTGALYDVIPIANGGAAGAPLFTTFNWWKLGYRSSTSAISSITSSAPFSWAGADSVIINYTGFAGVTL